MTQGSFYLEDDKYVDFKVKCIKDKTSMTEKIQGWIESYLSEEIEGEKSEIDKF